MLGSLLGAIGQGVIWGVMVLGIFITYKILNVSDLTVDGSFATGGAVFAVTALANIDPTICLIIAMMAGGVCGFITGLLHTKCKIPAILAGILTQLGLYSINLRILGDKANVSIANLDTNITFLARLTNLPHSRAGMLLGIIVSIICIIFLYSLLGTEFGASIRATGNNEKMIRALGVNTDNIKLFGITLSNMLIGLSGAMLVEMNKYADVGMGKGAIVYGLASIVIGEVFFRRFSNFGIRLFSSVFGCILFFIIRAIVIRLGLKANDMQLISAIIVVIALAMPIFKENMAMRNRGASNA
ncbi:MAG: ABC transporter permease [Lachnospiraceae bacterium]|nr:ABC transporter permease [Lachnospiraceae bacterium]